MKNRIGILLSLGLLIFTGNANAEMSKAESRVAREKIITEAKKYIGCPYVRGAIGPDTFDCSGLVYYVSGEAIQFQLPRTVKAMYSYVKICSDAKREPGDLVFFKTTGNGTISHVGIYVGNNQFISAASDGPNTGVILSSLKESYWGAHYAGTGKFLPESDWYETEDTTGRSGSSETAAKKSSSLFSGLGSTGSGSFRDRLFVNTTLTGDWSLFTQDRFMPNFRGISSQLNMIYAGDVLAPGIGTELKWNYGVKAFQIPVLFSLTAGKFVRVYAGPVFTIGKPYLPDTDDRIDASIFPGTIGLTFLVPSFTKGDVKVQLIQDINYSVFNNTDGSALSLINSLSSGLEFSTGVSVTMPFRKIFKK